MTTVRSGLAGVDRFIDVLTDTDRPELDQLIAGDPLVNAVIAARVAGAGTLEPSRLGGTLLGARATATGHLTGAVFNGGNLLPIGGDPATWAALAEHVGRAGRLCSSIVGSADAVHAMWQVLRPRWGWGPGRAVRDQQPLLVIERGDRSECPAHPDLRLMHPDDIDRYLPAAAAMFAEELGTAPFIGRADSPYRRRIESLLAGGRAFGIVGDDGAMVFKADIGALTPQTCQLQGVWVRPELRGQGIGTSALAGVLQHTLQLAPSVSLYVNDYNTRARRLYARLGMRQVGELATVLF